MTPTGCVCAGRSRVPRFRRPEMTGGGSWLPEPLAIALWAIGTIWLLAVVAMLFGFEFEPEMIGSSLLVGVVAGVFEWQARRRDHE